MSRRFGFSHCPVCGHPTNRWSGGGKNSHHSCARPTCDWSFQTEPADSQEEDA